MSVSAPSLSNFSAATTLTHTKIIYVNGMLTQPDEAELAWRGALSPLAERNGIGSTRGFLVSGFYDPTFVFDDTRIEKFFTCLKLKAAQFGIGISSAILTLSACIPDGGLAIGQIVFSASDVVEAAIQVVTLAFKASPFVTPNARTLADLMLASRQRGERIVLVTHSRGNLLAEEALLHLSTIGTWTEKDRACTGWVAIAPPIEPAQNLTSIPPSAMIVRGDPSVDILEKIFAVTRHNIVDGRPNELSADFDAMAWLWRVYYSRAGIGSGITLHSAVQSYFGMPTSEGHIKTALFKQIDALDTRCESPTATIRVNSNESAAWTLGPGDITRSGSQALTVRAARQGTQFTLTPATIAGKTVSVSNSGGTGNTLALMPGEDRTFTITYSSVGNTASATLTASPQSVTPGQASTLTWTSSNTNSCSASWTSSTSTSGSATVTPNASTTYGITCTGATGSASAQATVTVSGPSVPSAPTNLSASPAAGLISLAWSDNSTNESGFRIERSPAGSSAFAEIGTTGSNEAAFIDQDVAAGLSYSYRVRAYNGSGSSGYSNVVTATVPAGLVSVSLVANPQTINSGQPSILTWSSTGANSCSATWTTSTAVTGTQSVSPTNTTTYTITCVGPSGNASAQATVTVVSPTTPDAPSNLSGSSTTAVVSLAWSDNSSNETGFRIERAAGTTGVFSEIGTTGVNVAAFIDQSVTAATAYSYRVRAYNSAGNSAYSNTLNISTATSGGCPLPTVIDAPMHGSATWSPGTAGCVHYLVKGSVTVWDDLTIQPGTSIAFGANAELNIQGSLKAIGTAGSLIRFIGEQQVRGYWRGLYFYSNSAANELTYVEVAYAGGGGATNAANITVDAFDRLKLTNSLVRESAGIGVYVDNEAGIPSFSTNVLRNNARSGIRIGAEQLGQLDTGSDYVTANGTNYLDVYGTSIHIAQTWRITSAPIHLTGSSVIWESLTITPGMTFLLGPNAELNVQGSLTAIGTASSQIRFIGEQQVRGYWHGLYFYSNSAANELTYVEVAYAGGGVATNAANITVDAFDRLKLTNSLVRESSGVGVFVDNEASIPSFSTNVLRNNTRSGIRIGAEQLGQLDTGSDYVTANGTNYLDVYGTSIHIAQTWRITSTPIHLTGSSVIWEPLTVSPGMTFLLGPNAELNVQGSLTAAGTAALPIRFLGEQQVRGYWHGLYFYSNSAANELTYVEVAYAGGGGATNAANITVDAFDRLKLTHSLVRESAGVGVFVDNEANIPSFSANVLRNNTRSGVRIGAEQLGQLDTGSDYVTANGTNYLDVYGTSIHIAQTWRITSAPIHFTGSSVIWEPLTISPGMTFLLGPNAELNVQGSLTAIGTASSPIRFLGEQQVRGYWHGLYFYSNSAANELTYVEVAYAGGGGATNAANITVDAFDRLKLTNSLVRESAGWGLYVEPQGSVAPTPVSSGGNTFSNNTKGGSNVP
ncbi:MAG TPA: fibronectin type III domain-containing protein [Gemmatimonadaceae bacterium]|nr:fibronectin type III domain-containing protein [Gemmatimonadaceae bacterium]